MRILVLIAIGLLLYVILSNYFRKQDKARAASKTQQLVQCEHCGLHILQNEAVADNQHFYCSHEHLEADRQAKK